MTNQEVLRERMKVAHAFRDHAFVAHGFARRLLRARRRHGLTQAACSDLLKAPPSYVADIERGARVPSRQTAFAWAALLEVDPMWLAFGTEDAFSTSIE